MADGTKAGGDAPRTLFSLGRSGKRKGRADQASPLEDYPPRHAEEAVTDVATLDAPDADAETTVDAEATDAEITDEVSDEAADGTTDAPEEIEATADELAAEPCPSCSLPLVPGAMFCGECGTRVGAPEETAPAAVLLDDVVPGEPLPPEAEGSFEVAEPVTGSFEDEDGLDEDDLVDDDGPEIEESAVFGAFIAADDEHEAEPEPEAELVEPEPEAELVEEEPEAELVEPEPEAELVEEEPEAELVEPEPEAELVEEEPGAEAGEVTEADLADEPEAELAEGDAELVEGDEAGDHDGAVVPIVAAAGAAGLATSGAAEATPLESSAPSTAGGSGGGSKKGVWIGAAAAAAAVVLIIGVVAMGGGGGKSDAKKDDQVAAGSQRSTTTTAAPSTTESTTASTEAPTTSAETATTDTSAPASTATTSPATTSTVPRVVVPPPPPQASPANIQVQCPPNLRAGDSNAIVLHNVGGTATSFLITWSALKTGVTVSPTTGTVGANSTANVAVRVAPGTPGSGSRVIVKWSGGSTSCNILVM